MNKTHLIQLAISFGLVMRRLNSPASHDAAWQMVDAFSREAKQINPRFDREKFEEFIREVRDEERNAQGKRI